MEMKKPNLHNAEFLRSAVKESDFPHDPLPQIVFAGKSNVGKSSVINKLLLRRNFARVGEAPGKTTHINFFRIDNKLYLVDLPGYGYARVSKSQRGEFSKLITDYVLRREQMVFLFVLLDSRHEPQKIDLRFIEMLGRAGVPFGLVFTKTDKLSADRLASNVARYRRVLLESWEELPPVFLTSSEKKRGRAEILDFIDRCLRPASDR